MYWRTTSSERGPNLLIMDWRLPPVERTCTFYVFKEYVEGVLSFLEADVAHDIVVRQPLVEGYLVFERLHLVFVLPVDLLDVHFLHGHQVAGLLLEAHHDCAVGPTSNEAAFSPLDLALVVAGSLALEVPAVYLGAVLPLAVAEVLEVGVDRFVASFVLILVAVECADGVLRRVRLADGFGLDRTDFWLRVSELLLSAHLGRPPGCAADDRIRTCYSHAKK